MTSSLARWLALASFLILIYGSFLSASYLNSAPDDITVGAGALAPILTGLVACGSIGLAIYSARADTRRSWQMLLIGISMWVLADVIWGAQEVWGLNQSDYSFADILWVIGYLPIGASIGYYLPTLGNLLRDRRRVAFLVVVCMLPLIVFAVQLESLVRGAALQEVSWLALLPALYPVLDAFLAGGGLLIALYSRHNTARWPWLLIGAALVLWAYSDLFYMVMVLNDQYATNVPARLFVDLTYTLAYLVLAVGAVISIQSGVLSFAEE